MGVAVVRRIRGVARAYRQHFLPLAIRACFAITGASGVQANMGVVPAAYRRLGATLAGAATSLPPSELYCASAPPRTKTCHLLFSLPLPDSARSITNVIFYSGGLNAFEGW